MMLVARRMSLRPPVNATIASSMSSAGILPCTCEMCSSDAISRTCVAIRVNSVAPGPAWTPLIPSTMPPEAVADFGEQYPTKRQAQPLELGPVYVMLGELRFGHHDRRHWRKTDHLKLRCSAA